MRFRTPKCNRAVAPLHQHHLQSRPGPLLSHAQGRRAALLTPCILALLQAPAAIAFEAPPPGYSRFDDKLEGYTFLYPEDWIGVTTSGNDIFKRNPRVPDENVFVVASSPSSSKFSSVDELGTPDTASSRMQQQFLKEYMSTRIGVKRQVDPIFARSRAGAAAFPYPQGLLHSMPGPVWSPDLLQAVRPASGHFVCACAARMLKRLAAR